MLKTGMTTGRPTIYTAALADAICALVAAGSNLRRIALEESFPAQSTMYEWLDQHEEFSEKYSAARRRRADARSDQMDEIVEDLKNGTLTPAVARVMLSALQWQAGRENPKRYGDKLHLMQDGTGGDRPVIVEVVTGVPPRDKG